MVALKWAAGLGKWLLGVVVLLALFSACSDTTVSDAGGAGAATAAGAAGSASGAGGSDTPNGCHAERAPAASANEPAAFDANAVARAAAVIGACLPDDGVGQSGASLWAGQASSDQFYDRYSMQLECLANSACGCAATANCLGYTVSSVTTCDSGCIGDVFTACGPDFNLSEGYGLTIDCKSVGLRCDPAAICVEGAPIACDSNFVAGCNAAGQPEYCDNGLVRHGPTCTDLGLDCVAGACTGRGATCTSTGSGDSGSVRLDGTACAGSTLTACVGGKLSTVDCTTRGPGFSCQHVRDAFFCGLAAECRPPDEFGDATPTVCVGAMLEFCSAGRREHIDCLALGFTGCTVDTAHGLYGCTPGVDIP